MRAIFDDAVRLGDFERPRQEVPANRLPSPQLPQLSGNRRQL
jgi:hypothetical protein